MMVTRNLRSAIVIGYMLSITWIRRNLLSLVWLFATPFSILFIVTVTTRGQAFVQGAIGSLIFVVVAVGTGLAGDATWYRLEVKLHDYFVASPVHQTTFLLGVALAGLFFSVPAFVVLVPILVYLGLPLVTLPLAALAVGAVWLFSAAIGYLASTYVSNLRNGWQSGLLLSVIVGILPPAFYPAEVLPSNLLWVSYLVPTTHSVLLLRVMMGQTVNVPGWSPLIGWIALGAMLLLALVATSRVARWRQP
jgi:ABC-2 type transport system permease protein